jgi:hypothetical protein
MSRRPAVGAAVLVVMAVAVATGSVATALASPGPRGATDGAAATTGRSDRPSAGGVPLPFTRADWVPLAAIALLLGSTHVCVRLAVRQVGGVGGG